MAGQSLNQWEKDMTYITAPITGKPYLNYGIRDKALVLLWCNLTYLD